MFWMNIRGIKRALDASGRSTGQASGEDSNQQPQYCSPSSAKRRRGREEESMEWSAPEETVEPLKMFQPCDPRLHQSFSGRTKFDCEDCRLTGVAFTRSGAVVISDSNNRKVKIFFTNGKLKVECSIPKSYSCELIEPVSVDVLPTGEILACDYQAGNLKVFTSEGRCLTTIGRCLIRPCSLCVLPSGAIVVADEAKKDVLIFRSIADRKPTSLQKLNTVDLDMQRPSQVCVTTAERIVVLDALQERFILFSKNGKLCSLDVISKETLRQYLQNQNCGAFNNLSMCSGPDDSIIIGHRQLGIVFQYDLTQRRIVRQLLDEQNGIHPTSLASDHRGFMAAIEDYQSVKILQYMH